MADKVENIMEKMMDELMYYKNEEIFNKGEIKKIVKSRRDQEYQMQRKDAVLSFFLEAIKFEQSLERNKVKRKK